LQSKAEQQGTELSMTVYTAPPNQNGLVLGDGDVLHVNTGGTATNTLAERGSEVDVEGGTAVNTTLDGAEEIVASGIANGVTFEGNGTLLRVENPVSLQGILTFDVERGGQEEYKIDFVTTINSITSTASTITVNYGNNQSITYSYHLGGGNGFTTITQDGDSVQVVVGSFSTTAGHSPPGLSGHSPGPPGHFHPEPFKLFDARIGDLDHLSTPVIGLLHHLSGEFHL
jgi:hypothetical protein